jgi:hypothetical protein
MNDLIVVPQTNHWRKLKALVLDSVSSPITKRVYNLGLDEFFAWLSIQEPRPSFTKATVSAWRVALEGQAQTAHLRVVAASAGSEPDRQHHLQGPARIREALAYQRSPDHLADRAEHRGHEDLG